MAPPDLVHMTKWCNFCLQGGGSPWLGLPPSIYKGSSVTAEWCCFTFCRCRNAWCNAWCHFGQWWQCSTLPLLPRMASGSDWLYSMLRYVEYLMTPCSYAAVYKGSTFLCNLSLPTPPPLELPSSPTSCLSKDGQRERPKGQKLRVVTAKSLVTFGYPFE